MKIKLKDISVGLADGLKESENVKFEDLFYTGNNKYATLKNNQNKFIISGKKGTGKTILAKYFEKEQCKVNHPTITLTKREFILQSYIEKGSFELSNYDYGLFVEYVMLVEIAKQLVKNKRKLYFSSKFYRFLYIKKKLDFLNRIIDERVSIDNFILENYSTDDIKENEINLNAKVAPIRDKSYVDAGIKDFTGKKLQKKYKKNPYYNLLDKLGDTCVCLMKICNINIIFDDLDEMDDNIDGNRDLIQLLITFIECASNLNNEFVKNGVSDSRIIVLIRSDILRVLNSYSSNLNKILSDSELKLNWIKKTRDGSVHPLMDLIITKIRNSNNYLKDKTYNEVLKQFFPCKINGIPIVDHMLNWSFGRPRDFINMLNVIKDNYPNETRFKEEFFKDTQQEYSLIFTNELRNELSLHYDIKIVNECFKIIHFNGLKVFTLDDISKVLLNYSEELITFKNAKHFIDFAYEYGIIGNIWERKGNTEQKRKKYNFSWKYREDGFDKPDYNRKFYVHLALRNSLL